MTAKRKSNKGTVIGSICGHNVINRKPIKMKRVKVIGLFGGNESQQPTTYNAQAAQQVAYNRAVEDNRDAFSPMLGVSDKLFDDSMDPITRPRSTGLMTDIVKDAGRF